MSEVRPFEEYKEMIKDMRKDEMIRGLYDLSARVTKQENIMKEVREMLSKYNDNESNYYAPIDIALKILDKVGDDLNVNN